MDDSWQKHIDYEAKRLTKEYRDQLAVLQGEAAADEMLTKLEKQGLLRNEKNAFLIGSWLLENKKSFNPKDVGECLGAISTTLDWRSHRPAPSPPKPKPAPFVPVKLDDGSLSLPLGTQPSRRHTILQLKHLTRRMREKDKT